MARLSIGEVTEWPKVLDSKSSVRSAYRGFDSHPLRQFHALANRWYRCVLLGCRDHPRALTRGVQSSTQ